MLNIKKAITVSEIFNNLISLSLILVIFCLSGHLYAQTPPALDFPPEREFDPRCPRDPGEIRPENRDATAISENVELVGATGGVVYDVFVQDNYAYVPVGITLTILDVSAPSNPTKVGYVALPDTALGVYVHEGLAYVADRESGLRIIDVSSPSSLVEVGFYDTPGYARSVYVHEGLAYVADEYEGLIILRYTGGVPVYYGDVSGNGNITAFDASLILRVVVGILNLNEPEYPYLTLDRADVTGNRTVTALDAAFVLQYTVGLITQFPCQRPAGAPALSAEVEFKSPLAPLYQRQDIQC
jgi:hypothetical protein